MLDLRDSANSNWIKNVGQQDEGEEIEKSSPLLTLQDWLDKQSHNDLRPMNPPSRPPHKGAVWNSNTHRWSKAGAVDLDKQQPMKRGWHDHSEIPGQPKMEPHPGNVKDHDKWKAEQKEQGGDEQSFVESDKDSDKKAEAMTQPKGAISQKLKKFNDKVEKILKILDDLFGGHVDNPKQTFEDLEQLKGEVDQDIEDGKEKINQNKKKIGDLHDNNKITDEIEEKAYIELEDLRKHYERHEKEMNEKWQELHVDENYEKLKEKLNLEEEKASGDEEQSDDEDERQPELDEDEEEGEEEEPEEEPEDDEEDERQFGLLPKDEKDDNIFEWTGETDRPDGEDEEDTDEEDPQWEAWAKNNGKHDGAVQSGWGGEEHEEEDFHPETGELQVPGKNANDVREWAKGLEEKYDISLVGGSTGTEPHDDIYEHYDIEGGHMSGEPITAQHIADYVKEKTGEDVSLPGEELKEKTVEGNAQTLLDRTTKETDELKETRKEIERQQKLLERKLEGVGDDEESKKQITDQLSNVKNKVDAINTSIQTKTRKTEMANALLNKKPSLNGATQEE